MDLSTTTALVTGANRGFGRHLAQQLSERGATVYAAARRPESVDLSGVTPIALDITDPDSVVRAARLASKVTLLVNNAGISTGASLLTGDIEDVRSEFETTLFGTLAVTRAFVPKIESNGGGAILNVLSVLSWLAFPEAGAYSAAKSAQWSMTNSLRIELAPRNIRVTGLHVGYMDTDLTAGVDAPKLDPAVVAKLALDELSAGNHEIIADDLSRQIRSGLAGGVASLYPGLA
ncbi:short-chain dehydrogenase [Rhodococcus sp. 06-156-3C]|nr:short-chain dehydrogenase [Rhodococcus sp. 06-156-4C]OZD18961.1 short-chain dehydrogenase [Rhodococcus sp. 06-156-3C]OZD22474.1 short-chain dehydrogenase [Rhodococcus sp. 06-156-4a]OZD34175.1 short-chain dehydrogenase [Rhodococcus sp. 06-156-3b]OZD38912.1 short-chain dehydrogenase [Rhodococcus sp. 06-156-3]OZF57372.1 short-chain dehydrogenase [Rhodococcus sp. 06-156-4]